MSITGTRPIQFINTDLPTVEKMLRDGKTPREISDLLAEPLPNVMGVWTQLRNDGQVEARNFNPGAPAAAAQPSGGPVRPQHVPDPDLTRRIAGATDLLVKAADIDDKRIQAALGRARKAMTELAGLVTGWESKSAVRDRINRLEAELRIARAELRGEPATGNERQGGASPKQEMSPARREALEKMRAAASGPVDCPDCGKTMGSKAGLGAHKRGGKCTGTA